MKPEIRKIILVTIREQDGDAYGVSIAEAIEKQTGKRVSVGNVYLLLDKMEEENLIVSEIRKGGAERSFRVKKCYWLTGHGLAMTN